MNLLAMSWNRVHHNATSGPVIGYRDKRSRLASKSLEDKYIYLLDSEWFKNRFSVPKPLEHGLSGLGL